MARGFLYLVAVMDWYSRHVLAWRLSNTMDTSFCLDALDDALRKGGQRSSTPTRGTIHQCGIYRRARSRGRAHQHGWPRALVGQRVRRALWRSLKCEEVHLKAGACPRAGRGPDPWPMVSRRASASANGYASTTTADRTRPWATEAVTWAAEVSPVDLPLRLDDAGASPTTPQSQRQQTVVYI